MEKQQGHLAKKPLMPLAHVGKLVASPRRCVAHQSIDEASYQVNQLRISILNQLQWQHALRQGKRQHTRALIEKRTEKT
jgi:hypothetical protein